jgi:pimeloyl-ACP methyl ester carboxylesterase
VTTTATQPEALTLEVPGATLAYDIRRSPETTEPMLLMIGSPMGAAGFVTLAGFFPDRTVVTYDPRGVERSVKADPSAPSTPEEHANDLHRLIGALGGDPVDMFASSGGAVNALALVERHPEDVRTLVAHEPPVVTCLPDADAAAGASRSVHEAYLRDGFGAGMARFIALVSHDGPFPDDWADGPALDPAMFGLPAGDDGSRTDPLLGQNMPSGPLYAFDLDALRAVPTRVVIGAGVESGQTLAARAAHAVANQLGMEPVIFPSHHGGFLGGEYGQAGQPEAFAAKLREVLAS